MKIRSVPVMLAGCVLLLGVSPGSVLAADADPARQCAALKDVPLYHTTLKSAEWVANGIIAADPNSAFTGTTVRDVKAGPHCVVQGEIEPRTGVDGKHYGINFQLRLPQDWNGKFLFQGGGGANGFLAPALGSIPVQASSATPALLRGYAVVSMDSGHQGTTPNLPAVFDLAFAADQQARLDYAYAAIGKVTERAKQLIQANYQSVPKHSYYMGCSTGGRESMIAAQRYPNEFDGVVVGNAAFRLSRAMLGATWIYQHLMAAAPKNARGQKILANALSQKDLDAVVRSVLKRCDAKDGVADGIVNAWESCDFKPEMVQKEIGAKKVALLKAIFGGPKNSLGEALYAGFPFDTALTEASWRAWWLGTDASVPVNTSNNILSIPLLTHYFMQPYSTTRDPLKFDFDRDVASTLNTRGLNDGDSPNLKTFKANGGRMIIFDGASDPIFSAFDQRDWYRAMHETTGDAQSFARLFIVPGMTHCGGGRSLDDFDPLTALEQWREEGRAPAHLLAKGKAFPGKSQPICAYPTVTTYMGGDLNRAESYACK